MADTFRHQEVVTMGTLGRLGIPSKVRQELGIEEGDKLNLVVDGGSIVITKHVETCVLCHSQMDDSYPFSVCRRCTEAALGSRKLTDEQ